MKESEDISCLIFSFVPHKHCFPGFANDDSSAYRARNLGKIHDEKAQVRKSESGVHDEYCCRDLSEIRNYCNPRPGATKQAWDH
jgi:hypothetical protein